MTSHRTTADQQDAPFIIPGNAFATLFATAAQKLGYWLRTRREQRRQRLQMRQLRSLDNRMLKDIGVARSEIPYVVTQNGKEG